ncbi:hypothetical protein DL240_08665 [Lujinxingia litoralis]|uniref:Uncharacterized protein n=1 Tax=Lujinxingia litoralis TaxID=2211119 RepID=A0A328CB03_9DELT|nr:hypothetical protein [Lujinxingia litoralis]RAL22953.1 hypothetical protein DL240_08665 [Lujinxingia litoralis]
MDVDNVDSGQGSGKGAKFLKIAGIGCAAVILIGALFAGLGVFKAVSCVEDFVGIAESAQEGQSFAYEFVEAARRGDYQGVYDRLDPEAQAELSVAEVEQMFEPRREALNRGEPFPVGVRLISNDTDQGTTSWEMTTRIARPTDTEAVLMSMEVVYRDGAAGDGRFGVLGWEVREVLREMAEEPAAQMAMRFHREVVNERVEEARRFVDRESRLYSESLETFATNLDALQELPVVAPRVVAVGSLGAFASDVTLEMERAGQTTQVTYTVSNLGKILDFKGPNLVDATGETGAESGAAEASGEEAEVRTDAGDEAPE